MIGKILCFVGLHCWRLRFSDGFVRVYWCFRTGCDAVKRED